jgi:ribosomal protein S18 acetylase RimI-like enzyme
MLAPVARLNGRVFDDDPVIMYMLLEMPKEERLAYLPTYWSILIKSALLNDALITEADGWKAASVVIPPERQVDNVWTLFYAGFLGVLWKMGASGFKRLWSEFSGMTDNAKKIGLRGQKRYYYIFSIGTEVEHRGKGLAKAIMREHIRRAQLENVPIWLEATTPNSRKLYLSMGFEEIEEITLGKGKVDSNANLQPGGPGVPLWAMVWWPEQQSGHTSSS